MSSESSATNWFNQFEVPHPKAKTTRDCVIPGKGVGEKGRETCRAGGTALRCGPGDELGKAASPSLLPPARTSYSCLPSHTPCSCRDLSPGTAAVQPLPPGRSWHLEIKREPRKQVPVGSGGAGDEVNETGEGEGLQGHGTC